MIDDNDSTYIANQFQGGWLPLTNQPACLAACQTSNELSEQIINHHHHHDYDNDFDLHYDDDDFDGNYHDYDNDHQFFYKLMECILPDARNT